MLSPYCLHDTIALFPCWGFFSDSHHHSWSILPFKCKQTGLLSSNTPYRIFHPKFVPISMLSRQWTLSSHTYVCYTSIHIKTITSTEKANEHWFSKLVLCKNHPMGSYFLYWSIWHLSGLLADSFTLLKIDPQWWRLWKMFTLSLHAWLLYDCERLSSNKKSDNNIYSSKFFVKSLVFWSFIVFVILFNLFTYYEIHAMIHILINFELKDEHEMTPKQRSSTIGLPSNTSYPMHQHKLIQLPLSIWRLFDNLYDKQAFRIKR